MVEIFEICFILGMLGGAGLHLFDLGMEERSKRKAQDTIDEAQQMHLGEDD